jgi:uncharacterized protein (TIRG00374 family)
VVFFGRHEIIQAWKLLDSVDLWILALLIPVQLFSYYATAGMIFSYLRSKGDLKKTSHWQMTRMALELNFVHHILPSGGVAGFSYLGWVLRRHGVSISRSTMAQIVRFAMAFVGFVSILVVAAISLALDHQINRTIIIISVAFVVAAIGGIVLAIYVVGNHKRLIKISGWITNTVNGIVSKLTRGKKHQILKLQRVEGFFSELHQDYLGIRRDKRILILPFIWSLLTNILDVALISIAFLALGHWVNPAILFIAFGISSVAGIASAIPGGAGVYEAVMIAFLASAGVPADVAIVGTLLARVTLVVGTILFGYIFYQLTINKYGKAPSPTSL